MLTNTPDAKHVYAALRDGIVVVVNSAKVPVDYPSDEFALVASRVMPCIFAASSAQELEGQIYSIFADMFGEKIVRPFAAYDAAVSALWDIRVRCGVEASSVAEEFQRRRHMTWVGARWWLIPGSLGLLGLLLCAKGSSAWPTEGPVWPIAAGVSAVLLLAALVAARTTVRRNLRCPCCNAIPMQRSSRGSTYDWNPTTCAMCHARLAS